MNKKKLVEQILSMMDEKELEEILNSASESEEENKGHHEIKPKRRGGGFNKKNKRNKRSDNKSESKIIKTSKSESYTGNKFDDMLKDLQLTSEEAKELKAAEKIDDTRRKDKKSRPSTLVQANCYVCGKKEKVSRSLMVGSRYRCNDCCCNAR